MPAYLTVISTRTTPVDEAALLATFRATDPTIGLFTLDSQRFQLKKATAWTGPQTTQAQTAIDTAPPLTPQRQAQNEIDAWPIAQRSLVLALIDQLNVIRGKLSPSLGPIAPVDALAAVRAKAGTL